jgi:hypothetical protein
VGQALCYYILTSNGQVSARTTVQPLPQETLKTEATKQQIAEFDQKIIMKFGPPEYTAEVVPHPSSPGMTDVDVDLYEDARFELWEEDAAMPEADDLPLEFLDNYISAHVLLPKGDSFVKGQVIAHKRNANGNTRVKAHSNPVSDTRVYEVQFSDGHTEEYAANVIADSKMLRWMMSVLNTLSLMKSLTTKRMLQLLSVMMIVILYQQMGTDTQGKQRKVGNYASCGRINLLAGLH